MALNYVILTGTLGSGAAGAWATFTPTNWEFDSSDVLVLPPEPLPVQLNASGHFSISLLATDNANLTPSGWQWQVTFSGVTGVNTFSYNFLLPYGNGATQDLSAIPAAQPVTAMAAYLLLPTGNPQAGQAPVVQGNGNPQTAWGNPNATPSGAAGGALTGTYPNPGLATVTLAEGGTGVDATSNGNLLDQLGALDASENLGDLASAGTARTNLGLGSAATQASSAFDAAGAASTAQSNAETYAAGLQPTSGSPLGTLVGGTGVSAASNAALLDDLGALDASENLGDLNNAGTARTNLGLGSAATQASSAFDASGAAATAQANAEAAANAAFIAKQATIGNTGYTLVNGTNNSIITWTAPADGNVHRIHVCATLSVTTVEVGGTLQVKIFAPDGNTVFQSLFASAQAVGVHVNGIDAVIESGSTVSVQQNSALTSGASTLWAEIWGL